MKEVQATLELVQGQRNELRQEVKDLKAALSEAHAAQQVRWVPWPWHSDGLPAGICACQRCMQLTLNRQVLLSVQVMHLMLVCAS